MRELHADAGRGHEPGVLVFLTLRTAALVRLAGLALAGTGALPTSRIDRVVAMPFALHGPGAIEHAGSWDGTSTFLRIYLGEDPSILVLSTDGDAEAEELADAVDALLRDR